MKLSILENIIIYFKKISDFVNSDLIWKEIEENYTEKLIQIKKDNIFKNVYKNESVKNVIDSQSYDKIFEWKNVDVL